MGLREERRAVEEEAYGLVLAALDGARRALSALTSAPNSLILVD